jgi:hypothetical protein
LAPIDPEISAMREHAQTFVRLAAESFRLSGPVFEFRSVEADEHVGDAMRGLFPRQTYVSCRTQEGPEGDEQAGLAHLTMAARSAKTIICLGPTEQLQRADKLLENLLDVLAPGAVLLLVAPVIYGLNRHGQFERPLTPLALVRLLARLEASIVGWQGAEDFPHTVYALGCKGPVEPEALRAAGRFVGEFTSWVESASPASPWRARLRDWLRRPALRGVARPPQADRVQFALHLPQATRWKKGLFDPPLSEPSTGTRLDLL